MIGVRASPYPVPPSRIWSTVMGGTYAALGLAGAIVLAVLILSPQEAGGVIVLGLWGSLSLVSSVACLYGVGRGKYRWEWAGLWGIVMGTSIYLVVTIMNAIESGLAPLVSSLPTMLVFVYAVGLTLGRAVYLSLIDYRARKRVLAGRLLTGEIPEVPTNE